jgi:hypothetical protein
MRQTICATIGAMFGGIAAAALPCLLVSAGSLTAARAQTAAPMPPAPPAAANGRVLPLRTSIYNRGGFPGRYRGADGKVARFALKREAPLLDGGGREIGRARRPVMLNVGADKQMVPANGTAGDGRETYVWAWNTEAGSGWIARSALAAPPAIVPRDPDRNPRPPREAAAPLTVDAAGGTKKLTGLRHVNSLGIVPPGGGNKGEHYAGRNPGPRDFVYLLFAVPNVRQGGTAQDSIPSGGKFLPGLDEKGRPIQEVMTMYRGGSLNAPVKVTFLYGRAPGGDRYGWIARANVGDL